MHPSTTQYLKPSDEQLVAMAKVREGYAATLALVDALLPAGRYKALTITALEESCMWAMKAISRDDDGAPRPGALT